MLKKSLIILIFLTLSLNTFASNFKLTSPNIKPGQEISTDQIYNSSGCTGKNISPQLEWSGAPAGTKSFAVTVYDPDGRKGKGWWHWIIFNIPAASNKLELNAGDFKLNKAPLEAIQSQNDFGVSGYDGPCPPQGDKPHHYIFTVYALKEMLPLDAKSSAVSVQSYIQQNKLDAASIIAIYHR